MTQVESVIQHCRELATNGLPDVAVSRGRTASYEVDELPAINFKAKLDDGVSYANGLTRSEFLLDAEIFVHGDEPDALADPIVEQLHGILTIGPQLGGRAAKIQYKSRAWDFDEGDGSSLKLTVTYQITFLASANKI